MTPYQVIVMIRAVRDAKSIIDWLGVRSPTGAQRWKNAYAATLSKLAKDPLACGEAPERLRPSADLRQILFKTPKGKYYRAVFVIVGEVVKVLRIRGPHQRLMRRRDMPGID